MARAYTGNGLVDLVSSQGTPEPLDLDAVKDLIDAYVAAGGLKEALLERARLPAHVWAVECLVNLVSEMTVRAGRADAPVPPTPSAPHG